MPSSTSPVPLDILIVGAGIAGLVAALGLRQQGHRVSMYEKSRFNNEVGAALTVPPNVDGLLRKIGFVPEEHGGTREELLSQYTASGEVVKVIDFAKFSKFFDNEAGTIHRVDLHQGLRQMALAQGVQIHLHDPVVAVDAEAGIVELESGEMATGDVVVGADGIHSVVRKFVTGDTAEPTPFGISTFRLLIPAARIAQDPIASRFVEHDGELTVWNDGKARRFVTYSCRKNELINVVASFPERLAQPSPSDPNLNQVMADLFADFSPQVRSLIALARGETMLWRLYDLPALKTWSRGRTTLLGDAAHPLLPYSAQGGAQAIEDAITLAVLLPKGTRRDQVASRLQLYYETRHKRADWVQAFGRSMGTLTSEGEETPPLMRYEDYNKAVFRHDAWARAKAALALALEEDRARWVGLKVAEAGKFVKRGVGILVKSF